MKMWLCHYFTVVNPKSTAEMVPLCTSPYYWEHRYLGTAKNQHGFNKKQGEKEKCIN